ncbi:MAG: GlsB/YeaQ/YmgE family stress response membrane protein [Bryobacterales bacterium]|nr:GlsB/YeaQ/YmgE family stress response membrane protein [Bryobacterales bacterium]
MFSLIGTLISGLVVGVIAKFLLPGKDPGGLIVTIGIGIAGSFLGSWVGQFFGLYAPGQSAGWIMSVLGSILLLFGYRMVSARK